LDQVSAPVVEPQVMAALPENGILVLDLAKLRYCSSAGLRMLLVAVKQAAAQRARFGLAGVQPAVAEMLESTGVDKVVPSFPNAAQAAAALA
jgi:anti-anti-sigma factor